MGMHLDPVPSGKPEFNANELVEQNVQREYREAQDDIAAERAPDAPKKGFWHRLFGNKS